MRPDRLAAKRWCAIGTAAGIALSLTALTGCGNDEPQTTPKPTASATTPAPSSDALETAAATPRIAYTYDGGIQVRDANTLELVADIKLDGLNRLNPVGDGRTLMVTTAAGAFQVLDMGVWASAHGDHSHYFAANPVLTDQVFAATRGVHVVSHDGNTTLFDDESGHVMVFESDEALDADRELREFTTTAPHHGVAVPLEDGVLVVSEGTSEARTGARAFDANDVEIAKSDDCPGLHGEGVTAGEVVVFGCSDGVLTYSEGAFKKIASPAPAGRISTLSTTEESPIALGNYTVEGDTTPRVALIDTAAGTITPVELPTTYASSGLARTDDGAALVLGTDGQIHVIDVTTGTVTAAYPVVTPWELPAEAHGADPVPRILVLEGMIYVTDPATKTIHVVDPTNGSIWKSAELDVVPGELQGVSGEGAGEHHHHDGEEGHEDEHDHDDHEDEHDE
ncbi:MAG: hypothetical protein LBH68_07665 [Bifidobacteriaceae bacterium]|jgi:outer membrane protein assembly factor BamB|nr:hypothetical protein [Bifidobacteriaceae bacterium]